MKRILCLWLPHWPLQRLVVAQPALKQCAIILHHRDARRGQCVAICSRAAHRRGVRSGMPLAEATALLDAQDEVRVHLQAYEPQTDHQQLKRLAQWCERFSPLVGLETSGATVGGGWAAAECLLLDVSGIGKLFGGESALAEQVVAQFQQRGYFVQLAIADTIGAAWAGAHFPDPSLAGRPWILVPQQNRASLAPLPVAALRLPTETLQLLQQLGIGQIGQLLELPRSSLSGHFGDRLLQRLDQALGIAAELIEAHRPPPQFRAEWLLEHPLDQREAIDFVVAQLIERVALMLSERDEGALELECRLDCGGGRPLQLRLALFRPTAQPHYLMDLLRMQLERLALTEAVGRVGVQARRTAPLEQRQGKLFLDERRSEDGLGQLIDRLSSRLGSQAVLQGFLDPDVQPERAARYRSWVGRQRKRQRRSRSKQEHAPPPPGVAQRPLLLRSPPLVLEVVAVMPDGPPARFRYQGQTLSVARCWGPERIETAWWRGRYVRRDYYRVEATTGQRFWLFRELNEQQWFLHGEFQ